MLNYRVIRFLRKIFSRVALSYVFIFSTLFNSFAPTLLIITPAFAAESPQTNFAYISSTHSFDLSVSPVNNDVAYGFFYKTPEKIEAVVGGGKAIGSKYQTSIYAGTKSTEDAIPADVERGVLKNQVSNTITSYYFVMDGSKVRIVAEVPTSSTELSDAEESWLNDPETYGDLHTGVTYHAAFDQEVSLNFTSLPENPGSITIKQVTLTAEQIKSSGSTSNIAYDITSDMNNGDFEYDLSLAVPESSKGKEVGVKYAEELSEVSSAKQVENTLTKTDSSVSVASLDHMTIFVVVNSSPPPSNYLQDIVDNSDPGYEIISGTWRTSTSVFGYYGSNYVTTDDHTGVGQIRWNFTPTQSGTQEIFTRWTAGANRGTAVPFTITYDGGPTTVSVNQELNNGVWMSLGTYLFTAGTSYSVTLTNNSTNANDFVVGDAIKLQNVSDPTEVWVDDSWVGTSVGTDLGSGKIFGYSAFSTIQTGITGVSTDGTINVAAGTYTEVGQIVIDKNLTIVGEDKTTTIIKTAQNTGSDGDSRAWFLVNLGNTFNLSKITLNGESYSVREAIRHHGSGAIDDSVIINIKYQTYLGTGINNVGTGNVDVSNTDFSSIERVGVLVSNVGTGTFSNNTYIGKGVGDWLDYGFDIQYGAHVTINNNTISNNKGVALSDESDSSGISVWDDAGTQVTITNNTFNNNSSGVALAVGAGFGGPGDPAVTIGAGNVFDGGDVGVNLQNLGVGGSPLITFGASTFKGATTAIKIADGISVGETIDISNVIFKDSSDGIITDSSTIESLVYHLNDESNRGLLRWDYVAPTVPLLVSPADGASVKPAGLILDWADSVDPEGSNPVKYYYQSSYSSTVGATNTLSSPIYTSGILTNSQIDASGTANNLYYWQVRACDNLNNCSDWSGPWAVTVDSIVPTIPGIPSTSPSPTNLLIQNWAWATSTDIDGSGVKGYWQSSYDVLTSVGGSWSWLGNVLGASTSLTDGQWQLQLKAEDNAGNESGIVSSSTLTVDTIAPTKPVFTAPSNNLFTNINAVTLTWSGGDDTGTTQSGIKGYKIRYTFVPMGGGSTVNWSSSLITIGNPKTHGGSYGHGQGTYTIYISTTDNAGNVSSESDPLVLNYDATAPDKPTITSPTAEQYFKTTPILNEWGIITDPSGIKQYTVEYVYDDGHLFSGAPYRTTTTNSRNHSPAISEQGGVTIRVHSEDNAGNIGVWSDPIHYIYDATAPTFNSKTPFSGWYNSSQTSTFTYTDGFGVVSGNNPTCDITTEGTNQTCFVTPNVCDAAGNCNTANVTSNGANIDLTDPISTITAPSNSGTGSTIYTNEWNGSIAGTASDAMSGVDRVDLSISRISDGLYWNGAIWVTGSESTTRVTATDTNPWTYDLSNPAENSYTITSHAVDGAGNVENTYVLTIIFDKTIPGVTISLNPTVADASNGWYKTQPEVTLTATDTNIDKIEYQWDSKTGAWSVYSVPFKPASEGARVLYYRSLDKASNYSDIGIKNIKWDKTELSEGPQNVSVSPNPTSGNKSTVTWKAASDNAGIDHYEVQWKLGNTSYTDSVGSDVRSHELSDLTEGDWTVIVRAFDAAGNNKEASVGLIVDRTAPQAPALALTGTAAGSASLGWDNVDEAKSYIIWYGTSPGSYLYGANVGDVTSFTVQGLGGGTYYFVVQANDASGNGSANSNEVSTGTIEGAPGAIAGAPATGFEEQPPTVLGAETTEPSSEVTPAGDDTQKTEPGSVLGVLTSNNFKWWYWLIPLFLLTAHFGFRWWSKRRRN